jgi:hypothetical protein
MNLSDFLPKDNRASRDLLIYIKTFSWDSLMGQLLIKKKFEELGMGKVAIRMRSAWELGRDSDLLEMSQLIDKI